MKIGLPDLHRSGTKPQWETIPLSKRNHWQRRAAKTHGYDTPGNRETLKGLILSLIGIALIDKKAPLAGTALIGWGRIKDLQDGQKAATTGTKGPKGEAFDAITDSILLVRGLPVLKRRGIISSLEHTGIIYLTIAKFITAAAAKLRGRAMHTGRINKLSMFSLWGGIGLHLVGRIASKHKAPAAGSAINKAGKMVVIFGIILGIFGMVGYLKPAFGRKKRHL